jgi:hypothetical protein
MRSVCFLAVLVSSSLPALADRPVSDAERVKLVAAISGQGCNGGKLEWDADDRQFEVDDAVCNDGRKYDLKFDAEYRLVEKKQDD